MSRAFHAGSASAQSISEGSLLYARPAYQAYILLYLGYVALPLLAGLDKFANLLVAWEQYLAPIVTRVLPMTPHAFMLIVGIVEIIAAVLVAFRPSIGAYVVALWLWGIILNLLLVPGYFDIALRDFGLSIGALALARLSQHFDGVLPLGSRPTDSRSQP